MGTLPMWKDDRTPEQRTTHTTLIAGKDIFLGSWGPGRSNGGSTAIWSCTPEHALKVLAWVEQRSDMRDVRNTTERNARRLSGMVHIYTVEEGHPALS
jgi:hypothetical protein